MTATVTWHRLVPLLVRQFIVTLALGDEVNAIEAIRLIQVAAILL
jgi:hypothetical protein